ncbi:MAG: hypothetical protein SOV31_05705 [Candidatus Cryptobacteroides sp.]|nr:hypothetical protein [Candidatus Cryptobacteroides sp.]
MIPKSGLEIKNRCTKEGVNGEKLTSILKSGLEFKNQCTQEAGNEEILASILRFGLEIKNRCTKEGVNGEKLTSILKSGPKITNRCRAAHPPARVPSRVEDASCFGCLHGRVRRRFDSGGKSGC